MVRALCDTGAQTNLIQRSCVRRLGVTLEHAQSTITIRGIGGRAACQSSETAIVGLHTRFGEPLNISATFHVVHKICEQLPREQHNPQLSQQYTVDELADPHYHQPGVVDAILGAGVLARIIEGNVATLADGYLAQQTALGRIIFGADIHCTDPWVAAATIGSSEPEDQQLDELLRYMWARDEPKGDETAEDVWFAQYFQQTHERDENGRYIVCIPLRPNWQTLLGESRQMAQRRFYQLEARFDRSPELRANYIEFMREYEALGHMRRVPPSEATPANGFVNYIPHHALPPPRKFRVVFDASATTTSGKSFNEMQYTAKRLMDDLDIIVMRFRVGKYAMSADITKMFRQIRIARQQYDLQRIIWRPSRHEPLQDYQLTVVTYGTASAPSLAEYALCQCAEDHRNEFPLGAEIVRRNFYVDDCLRSDNDRGRLREGRKQLIDLVAKGGIELAKWSSNLPDEAEAHGTTVTIGDDPVGLLGLYWEPAKDILRFRRIPVPDKLPVTKRRIVSQVAKLYDPIGLASPVIIQLRAFIQQLWKLKLRWDEEVDAAICQQWQQMQAALPQLSEVQVPRWLGDDSVSHQQIHIFCDASRIAFGAVAYMRNECVDGISRSQLVLSKAYVAGVQGLTIPRLELKAAVVAARMAGRLHRAYDIPSESVHFWTDSEVVLYWIRRPSSRAKIFVATRVAEIQSITNVLNWHHVSTRENPADILSRGASVPELLKRTLWWTGPPFLRQDINARLADKEDKWSQAEAAATAEYQKELPAVEVLTVYRGEQQIIELFSSLEKVLRVTAYILRFTSRCRQTLFRDVNVVQTRAGRRAAEESALRQQQSVSSKVDIPASASGASSPISPPVTSGPDMARTITADTSQVPVPTPDERDAALKVWIRSAQRDAYRSEYAALRQGQCIPRGSKLLELTPFIDDEGIMRARGRLAASSLSYDQKHPIILPSSATLTRQLVRLAHLETFHGGAQLTIHKLREHYWIPRIRQAVRAHTRSCVICTRHRAITEEQLMADLPSRRVQQAPPFSNCGVDFAGPIKIKAWGGRNAPICHKAYIAVFVCFLVKAVHLELVSDLTTAAFLDALDRMMARKGKVRHMSSDNGRNNVGAASELKQRLAEWAKVCEDLKDELADRHIEWHFITPLAPHHGGLWEAAVKSVKYHLVRAIGSSVYTYEQMSTLLARIEACLNSRPLTPLTDDPSDLTALTPAHFLGISPAMALLNETTLPTGDVDGSIGALTRDIWQRWHTEYLTLLSRRGKWRQQQENLQVGDLAVLKQDNAPPGVWPLARVVAIHPGQDGLVRSVTIRTQSGIYRRPVVKLCRLPIGEPEASHQATGGFPTESAVEV